MSTKTSIKRIAAVAAVALTLGGFSAVSAHALTAPTIAGSATSTTASITTGTYTAETFAAGSADKYYTITTSGVGSVNYPSTASGATLSATSATTEIWSAGSGAIGTANFAGTESLTVSVVSAVAGTQVITLTGNTSTAITLTITWGAAPVVSAANSKVIVTKAANINAGTVETVTSDTLTPVVKTAVTASHTTAAAAIWVNLLDNSGTSGAAVTADKVGASVSGPGLLAIGASNASGSYAAADTASSSLGRSVTAGSAGQYALVLVYADGTSGTSTITVTDSTAGTTLGTVTVTFYSSTIAKLVATTNTNVPLAAVTGFAPTATEGINGSSVATGGAPVSVVAYDSLGNTIPSASGITVTSGTTAVATVGSLTYDATNGYTYVNIVPVAEGKSVLTFTDTATGLVTASATVLVTKAVASTVVASTDAASYASGVAVKYLVTAADAAGNPIADGTYTGFFTTAPTSNVATQGSYPTTTSTVFAGGVSTSTSYSPIAAGTVTIAGGTVAAGFLASATATATNSASYSVSSPAADAAQAAVDAANEATDAANAATDAANNAMDSADAAQQAALDAGDKADAALAAVTDLATKVSAIASQIASLSALVKKIAAKVKA